MAAILGAIAVSAALSIGMGVVQMSLAQKRANKKARTLEPAPSRSSSDNLTSSVDVGAAQIGIFGHRRVGGKIVLSAKSGVKTYIVTAIAGAPVTAINAIHINNRRSALNGSGVVTVAPWNAGSGVRVKLYDGTQTTVDPWLAAAFGAWSDDHKGLGIAYAVVEINPTAHASLPDLLASGVPDITFDVAGFKCYDPREVAHDIGDPATWEYSNNVAIVKANYLIHDLGARIPTADIDWDSVATAADICDELVPLVNGGNEARYTCSALWNTDERHEDVLARMGAADGTSPGVHLVGTKWRVYSGAFTASSATVTPADYAGDGLSWADTPPLAELCNGVRGKFTSPLNNWEDRDFPAYVDAAAVTADGREAWLDLDLAFVTSAAQAQRLAKIALMKARLGFDATLEAKFDLFDTIADDVITLNDTLAGFTGATFRVASDEVTDEFACKLSLEYETADFWDWDETTDESAFSASPSPTPLTYTVASPGGFLHSTGTNLYFTAIPSADTGLDKLLWSVNAGAQTEIAFPTAPVLLGVYATGATLPTVQIQGKCGANGQVASFQELRLSAATVGSVAGHTDATATQFRPPAPATPQIYGSGPGFVTVLCPPVNGAKSTDIEFFGNTTDDAFTAISLGTVAIGAGGAIFTATGVKGAKAYVFAKTKNSATGVLSVFSPGVLIVFP